MPLPDEASLFIPYTAEHFATRDVWVAVQKRDDEIIYMSPIEWPTQEEAERYAHDLNYLRERTLERITPTNIWVSIDIVSDGPDALVVLEKALGTDGRVAGWRLLNPAADADNDAWESARRMVQNAVDALAQEELPEDEETLQEHLANRHDVPLEDTEEEDGDGTAIFDSLRWSAWHRKELHKPGADIDHTHEWNEEVEDDASDEEEGAYEDSDS